MGLSRARAPGEYHIALSEALREAAVARFSEWLRQVRSAAGQHPTWLATFESAERLAVTRIPLPSGWRRSQAQGLAATRTPGSVGTVRLRVVRTEFDKSESCAVHWQSNLSEWSRPAVDGLTILLSTSKLAVTVTVNTAMPVGTVTGLAVDHPTLKLRSTGARVHTRRHNRPLAPDQYSGASAPSPQVPTRTGVPQ